MASSGLIEHVVYQLVAEGSQSLLMVVQDDQLRYRAVPRIDIRMDQKLAYMHRHNKLISFGTYDYVDRTQSYFSVYSAPTGNYSTEDWDVLELGKDLVSLTFAGKLYFFALLSNYYKLQ